MTTWKHSLQQTLQPSPDSPRPRLVVVGVGQTLRGDDGAGSFVAHRLYDALGDNPSLRVIDARHAPENYLGPIVAFRPDLILFVDVACAGGAPGDVVWLRAEESDSAGGGTHALSLAMLAGYLTAATGAAIYALGIEPAALDFGEGVSPPVAAAVDEVVTTIAAYWRNEAAAASAMTTGDRSVVNA